MSEPTCISLEQRFGKRYRVSWEAESATRSQWAREDWPWLMEIRGRYGMVYSKEGEILQATTNRPRIGAQLRTLRCVLTDRGDVETVITFHVDDAAAVVRLIKPYRRRQVSEAERERLAALSGRFGFGAKRIVESDFPASKPRAVVIRKNPWPSMTTVRRATAGRRLDMFAGKPHEGFDAWGNEAH